jgi:hypothetical protein
MKSMACGCIGPPVGTVRDVVALVVLVICLAALAAAVVGLLWRAVQLLTFRDQRRR